MTSHGPPTANPKGISTYRWHRLHKRLRQSEMSYAATHRYGEATAKETPLAGHALELGADCELCSGRGRRRAGRDSR